jgi:hypothetical protein
MLGTELSPEESAAIIAYARQKFAEERYPLSPGLRPVREALAKLDPKPEPRTCRAWPFNGGRSGGRRI